MPLRDELPRQGAWLFRWRSYLPLLVFALVLVAMRRYTYIGNDARLHLLWELSCLAVSLLGLAVRSFAVGCAAGGTSGRNTRRQVAQALNTTGAYSLVRHPLYVGNFLMWLGVALFPHQLWLVAVVVLVFWLYYERIMFAEEDFLTQQFGDAYVQWASRTPAFIPDLRGWVKPDLGFSLRNVLKREYASVFAMLAAFATLDALGDYVVLRRWQPDWLWLGLVAFGALIYVVLRTLRRRTTLLSVEGR